MWFVSKGHVIVVLPQSNAAEQNLRAPHLLRSLVFTAQYKLHPNISPPKLTDCSALCIHFTLIAGVNCHGLITEKCHPDTGPCYPPFVNPQQQNHRNKLHCFKGDEALQYTSNLKMAPRTAKRVLLGCSYVVICVKRAPDPSDHSPNAPVRWWVMPDELWGLTSLVLLGKRSVLLAGKQAAFVVLLPVKALVLWRVKTSISSAVNIINTTNILKYSRNCLYY